MNERCYLLPNSTRYNHKNLDIIDVGEEVNTWIQFGENVDVVDNVLQLRQCVLIVLYGLVHTDVQPDKQVILEHVLS